MPDLCGMSLLKSLMSYAWPVTEWEGKGRYGPLKLIWEQGHLVVNSKNANQSYGNLHAIWQQCLDEQAVARREPRDVLLLGFGGGSSAHIIRKELGLRAPITGVDGDPEMLRLAKTYFNVEKLGNLQLIESDASEFLQKNQQRFDLVLVDLCHELDLAPGVDEDPFIQLLAGAVSERGLICFNTIDHDHASGQRSKRVGILLADHFCHVGERIYHGINRVFSATGPRDLSANGATDEQG